MAIDQSVDVGASLKDVARSGKKSNLKKLLHFKKGEEGSISPTFYDQLFTRPDPESTKKTVK